MLANEKRRTGLGQRVGLEVGRAADPLAELELWPLGELLITSLERVIGRRMPSSSIREPLSVSISVSSGPCRRDGAG